MTKEEMLKKIGELSDEQKDFLKREIKKRSSESKSDAAAEEKSKEEPKK